jgi:hypothetical protein
MSDTRLEGWLASAQPLTGPARLALIGYLEDPGERDPLPWPLSRPPAENEFYPVVGRLPRLDESSGAEINDPGELSALRAASAAYAARPLATGYTPLVWTDPDTQQVVWFHMLLRDELPARVRATLGPPVP